MAVTPEPGAGCEVRLSSARVLNINGNRRMSSKKTVCAAGMLRKPFLFPDGIDNPAVGAGRRREAAGGFAIARTRSVKRQRRAPMATGLFYLKMATLLKFLFFAFVPVTHRAEVAADAAVNFTFFPTFTHWRPPCRWRAAELARWPALLQTRSELSFVQRQLRE